MVEGTDTGWLVVLEKNGLGPAAAILEVGMYSTALEPLGSCP